MTKIEELYGKDYCEKMLEDEKNIAKYKISQSQKLLGRLQKIEFHQRDDYRIDKILQDIQRNREILSMKL